MKKEQQKVRDFMDKASQKSNDIPTVPSDKDRLSRVRLILEEALEFAEASGVEVRVGEFILDKTLRNIDTKINEEVNLIRLSDALADIEYINLGSGNTYGIEIQPIFNAVHRSNMKKFTGDAHRNENGKWVKPTGWKEPNFKKLLEKQFVVDSEIKEKELNSFKAKYKNK